MARCGMWSTLAFALLLLPCVAHARQPILQHSIGDTITACEADQYSLFRDVPDFHSAVIADSVYTHVKILRVYSRDVFSRYGTTYLIDNSVFRVLPLVLDRADSLNDGLPVSDGVSVEITPKHGPRVFGKITEWTGFSLHVTTQFGYSDIPIEQIDDIEVQQRVTEYAQFTEIVDANRTRLFFMPTGRSLGKGEGYFAVYEAVMPGLQVGFGHKISVGGAFFPWSIPYATFGWFTGQVGIVDTDNYSFAVGNLTTLMSGGDGQNAGIIYGVGSAGSSKASGTFGLGFGFVDGFELADRPFVVIGGELQTGRRAKLITENWMIPGVDWPVVSLGMRWFGDKLSVDFAIIRPLAGEFEALGIPWVDFVVHF
ncbi:hypothetical protein KQI52_09850 [bacterium]|nr:hypothetical protein [bacterium]